MSDTITPDWLPDLIPVDGEFRKVIAKLYNIFHRDFIESKPNLQNMTVWHDRRIKKGETYEEGFWHLVERDEKESGLRSFDPERAKRLPWCAPLINNSKDESVKCWFCEENRKIICYVWLEDLDYIVILEKRKLKSRLINNIRQPERTIAFLKTAYYIDWEQKRRNLRKKYEERII